MRIKATLILLFFFMVIGIAVCTGYPARGDDRSAGVLDGKPVLAPGVFSVSFIDGKATSTVLPGDVVAVFSTASATEKAYDYTIKVELIGISSRDSGLQLEPSGIGYSQTVVDPEQPGNGNVHAGVLNQKNTGQGAVIGDRRTFWTWDLSDISKFPDLNSVQMTGILKAIGAYCEIFIDEHSRLTVRDAEAIARQYDSVAYPVVTQFFGYPPMLDKNQRIIILLPLAFNGGCEDEPNPQGFSFGAFNDKDQLPHSPDNPYSNERNILYLNPGAVNSTNPDYHNKWRSILSHEFQHMVNYRYHENLEAVAIDEGKAMFAEILSGYGLTRGDALMWENVDQYQKNPGVISLLQMSYSPENPLATYGMGLLWISYLFDRFGPETFYAIATNPLPGLGGAEAVTGLAREDLFAEWVQANIVNETVDDPVFHYLTIDLVGDHNGRYYQALEGFAARVEHEIPEVYAQRQVLSYGVEYFRATAAGILNVTGDNIRVLIIGQET